MDTINRKNKVIKEIFAKCHYNNIDERITRGCAELIWETSWQIGTSAVFKTNLNCAC